MFPDCWVGSPATLDHAKSEDKLLFFGVWGLLDAYIGVMPVKHSDLFRKSMVTMEVVKHN